MAVGGLLTAGGLIIVMAVCSKHFAVIFLHIGVRIGWSDRRKRQKPERQKCPEDSELQPIQRFASARSVISAWRSRIFFGHRDLMYARAARISRSVNTPS